MIRAIIIDDEEDARESLRLTLEAFCSEVEIISFCSSGEQGLKAIRNYQPDLVFLDVQMPHMSGFQLLEKLENINFKIIFVTAYDQYAIKAIKFSALDYLVKPVDADELINAIGRLKNQQIQSDKDLYTDRISSLFGYPGKTRKLAVPTSDRIHFLDLNDIIFFEANGNYTLLHLKGNKSILASKTLKEFELLLDEENFCRVHHAALINLDHVQEYFRGEGGYVRLIEGHHVDVSRRRKEEFLRRITRN
jgi:two-component system LytT family response regulator